ncbi:MAG: serine hydrolase, partial [Pseudomonadota bacterium]
MSDEVNLVALPEQPQSTPWPTLEWPTGRLRDETNTALFNSLLDHAFSNPSDLGKTHAFLAIQNG